MDNDAFIGTGINPNGRDMPLGLGMQLAQEGKARVTFGQMSTDERDRVINYVQGAKSGDDAKARIAKAVENLKQGRTDFF